MYASPWKVSVGGVGVCDEGIVRRGVCLHMWKVGVVMKGYTWKVKCRDIAYVMKLPPNVG